MGFYKNRKNYGQWKFTIFIFLYWLLSKNKALKGGI